MKKVNYLALTIGIIAPVLILGRTAMGLANKKPDIWLLVWGTTLYIIIVLFLTYMINLLEWKKKKVRI